MNFLIKFLLPLIETTAETELLSLLQKMHDTHPAWFAQLIIAVYPAIDVQLENYTASTKSTIDDDIVQRLKRVLETAAAANKITLPNLDKD